jgi:hypothetical protein
VSTETILFNSGLNAQRPTAVTLISPISRRFTLAGREYLCRKLADSYLYQDEGIIERNGVRIASPERAAADLLYYNPQAYFDGLLNWQEVRRIQETVGYPLTPQRYQ